MAHWVQVGILVFFILTTGDTGGAIPIPVQHFEKLLLLSVLTVAAIIGVVVLFGSKARPLLVFIRVELIGIILEMAFAHARSHEFLQPPQVLLAECTPERRFFLSDEVEIRVLTARLNHDVFGRSSGVIKQ